MTRHRGELHKLLILKSVYRRSVLKGHLTTILIMIGSLGKGRQVGSEMRLALILLLIFVYYGIKRHSSGLSHDHKVSMRSTLKPKNKGNILCGVTSRLRMGLVYCECCYVLRTKGSSFETFFFGRTPEVLSVVVYRNRFFQGSTICLSARVRPKSPVVQVSANPLRSHAGVEFVGDPFVRKLYSHVAPVQELKAHALVQLDLEDTGRWRHVCAGIIPPLSHDVPVFVGDEPPRLWKNFNE